MFTGKRLRKLLFAILASALWVGLATSTAFAISDPDSIAISDIRAYESVLESDDMLVIVEYNLPYTVIPDEIISDAFLARFLRDTTELRSVEPFAFNDKGYGRGIFSFYWTATQKAADSIEFGNPNLENYKVVFQGKVGVFIGTVPSITGSSISYQDISQTATLLFERIEALARALENDPAWADDPAFDNLIENPGGQVQLTTTGEEYFSNAIPQLVSMIPTIFTSGVTSPDFSQSIADRSFETEVDKFWDGNWIDAHFDTLATTFDAPKAAFTSLVALIMMGVIAFAATKLLGGQELAAPFGIMTMAVSLPMFGAVNWIPLNMVITIAFVFGILGLGWVFFLRRAGG